MKRITQFDGLYGESGPRQAADRPNGEYMFSELLETRSRTFDWVIQPHIHARLFQVFFVETGSVSLSGTTGKRELTAPFVLLIPPTVLHGFVYSPQVMGRILTLSDTLVESLFPSMSAVATMLNAPQCLTTFGESYTSDLVSELIRQVDDELFADQPEKQAMLRACLQRLFVVFIDSGNKTKLRRQIPTARQSIFPAVSAACPAGLHHA